MPRVNFFAVVGDEGRTGATTTRIQFNEMTVSCWSLWNQATFDIAKFLFNVSPPTI